MSVVQRLCPLVVYLMSAVLAACESESAGAHYDRATALVQKQDVDGAIREYRASIRLMPDVAVVHNNLGVMLRVKGEHDLAMVEFRAAIALDADDPLAHVNLANELARKRKYDAAIVEYRAALAQQPNDPRARSGLAVSLLQNHDAAAVGALHDAIALSPNDPYLHAELGDALMRLKGDLDGAAQEIGVALDLDPNDPSAHNNMGNVLRAKGDFEAATREYRETIRLAPELPFGHANLADMALRAAAFEAASQEYAEARRLDPLYFGPPTGLESIVGETDELAPGRLVGHWRKALPGTTTDVSFRNDGTYSGRITSDGKTVAHFAGKWTLNRRLVEYEYTESSGIAFAAGTKDRDRIVAMTSNSFILEDLKGRRSKYVRID